MSTFPSVFLELCCRFTRGWFQSLLLGRNQAFFLSCLCSVLTPDWLCCSLLPLLRLLAPGIRSSKTFFELHKYGWLCCFWFVYWLSHSFWASVSSWFLTTPIAHVTGCLCCFRECCLPHRLNPTVLWFEKLGWDAVHGPSCSQSKKQVKTSQH